MSLVTTIPARSEPRVRGNGRSGLPRVLRSSGLIVLATVRTSTWPGPAAGGGTSRSVSASMPPGRSNCRLQIEVSIRYLLLILLEDDGGERERLGRTGGRRAIMLQRYR